MGPRVALRIPILRERKIAPDKKRVGKIREIPKHNSERVKRLSNWNFKNRKLRKCDGISNEERERRKEKPYGIVRRFYGVWREGFGSERQVLVLKQRDRYNNLHGQFGRISRCYYNVVTVSFVNQARVYILTCTV